MKNQIVCPANCIGGHAHRVKSVSQRVAGITPEIARAAKLSPNHLVSTCTYCGCVWREFLNPESLVPQTDILGEYGGTHSAVAFRPEPWLQETIDCLEKKAD
jgi:hypothetical protein